MTRPGRLNLSMLATAALLAWGLLPDGLAEGRAQRWREVLRNDLPSAADYERMERGYYEQLLDAGRRPDALVGAQGAAPARGDAPDAATAEDDRLTRKVSDVREFVLKSGLIRDPDHGVPWSTNRHGMRDREYPEAKPPGTFRIALAGDSIAAGWGVGDEEGFEPILERAFAAKARAAGGPNVEILNFAVPGHGPGQRWSQFEAIGWTFQPDLVIFEATPADAGWDERRLRHALARGVGFDAPVYRETLAAAGVKRGLPAEYYRRGLKPLRWEILAGVYRAAAAECHSRGVPAYWVLIPRVGKPIDPTERDRLLKLAHDAGFDAVIDATGAYGAAEARGLAVGPNDFHPNSQGHALIARALGAALAARPELSRLWTAASQGTTPR